METLEILQGKLDSYRNALRIYADKKNWMAVPYAPSQEAPNVVWLGHTDFPTIDGWELAQMVLNKTGQSLKESVKEPVENLYNKLCLATSPSDELNHFVHNHLSAYYIHNNDDWVPNYTGNLNAAIEGAPFGLTCELLSCLNKFGTRWHCVMVDSDQNRFNGYGATPALAVCAALCFEDEV